MTVSVLILSGCGLYRQNASSDQFTLTIMHMNDTHSHLESTSTSLKVGDVQTYAELGGFTKIASEIKKIRKEKPDSVLLHAGDAVQGTYYFTKYNGQPEYEILSMLNVDAMEPGNHEFDRGPGFLPGAARHISFPVVSANIDTSGDENLKKIIKPYVIKEVAGQKIGIFGLITPETAVNSNPGKNIGFVDEKKAAESTVKELEKSGVNKIIALTHLGYEKDLELARAVNGIDVIVGGHSHTLLGDFSSVGLKSEGAYPTEVVNGAGEKVFVVQSWEWGKALGVLDVEFDGKGRAVKAGGSARLVASGYFTQKGADGNRVAVPAETRNSLVNQLKDGQTTVILEDDPETAAKLAPYKSGVEEMQKLVVAKVSEPLLHIRKPGRHSSGADLPEGSQIAPVICESMLWKANSSNLNVEIAVLNGGGVRMDLAEGNLTVATVNELLPFQNRLILIELSGKELKNAIETGLADSDGSGGGFTYAAGMRYEADLKRSAGGRLIKVEVSDSSGKWKPVKDASKYRVITNSYLASGGNGYESFKNAAGYRYDTGYSDAEAFMEYAKTTGTIKRMQHTGIILK